MKSFSKVEKLRYNKMIKRLYDCFVIWNVKKNFFFMLKFSYERSHAADFRKGEAIAKPVSAYSPMKCKNFCQEILKRNEGLCVPE